MNKATWKKGVVVTALTSMLVLTACTGKNASSDTTTPTSTNQAAAETPAVTETPAATPVAKMDPLGKYDPPIEVSNVKSLDDGSMKFIAGESIDNNVWTKGYEQDLGIKVKVLWLVPDAQYDQKLNVTIASNDLPDIMTVNAIQLKQLVDNGMIEDLTQVYNDYKSDFTNDIMTGDGGLGLKQSTFGGKLMAIPLMNASVDSSPIMWIRKDWLDSQGLQPPKTMDDVFNIAKAFTENDPDKNGKKDTFGLGVEKGLFTEEYGLNGFFNGYHAMVMSKLGNMLWNKDSSGKLIAGEVVPQAKAALAKLAEMYKAGYLDKEFAVKDGGKVSESVTSQKVGMFYGLHWNAWYPLPDAVAKNPKADWRPYSIASVDGNITVENALGVSSFYVVKKGMKNPEAAVKMLNYFLDKENGLSKGYDLNFHMGPAAKQTPSVQVPEWKYPPIYVFHPKQNILIYQGFVDYRNTKDPNKLSGFSAKDPVSLKAYDDQNAGIGGAGLAGGVPTGAWPGWVWTNGPFSSYSVIAAYMDNKQTVAPLFYGPPTSTMTARQSTLDKMALEEYTKIIMGAAPVDDFDRFVESWNAQGGADITKEVNDWAATQK